MADPKPDHAALARGWIGQECGHHEQCEDRRAAGQCPCRRGYFLALTALLDRVAGEAPGREIVHCAQCRLDVIKFHAEPPDAGVATANTFLEISHASYLDLRDRLSAVGIVPSAWTDGRQGLWVGRMVLVAPINSPGGECIPFEGE